MILSEVFSPRSINVDLKSEDKDELFEELIESIIAIDPDVDRKSARAALDERECKMSTGVIHDIAVPHGKCASVHGVKGAIGISRGGIEYDALDKMPVHLVFMLLSSPDESEFHLQILKRLATVLEQPDFKETLLSQTSSADVYDTLCRFESAVVNAEV